MAVFLIKWTTHTDGVINYAYTRQLKQDKQKHNESPASRFA